MPEAVLDGIQMAFGLSLFPYRAPEKGRHVIGHSIIISPELLLQLMMMMMIGGMRNVAMYRRLSPEIGPLNK